MNRRPFVLAALGTAGLPSLSAQDPRVEAAKLLIALLIPFAQEQIKKWLQSNPENVPKASIFKLHKALENLNGARERYADALKEYLRLLRYHKPLDDAEDRATHAAAEMLRQVTTVQAAFEPLRPGFRAFDPHVDEELNAYLRARRRQSRLLGYFRDMPQAQRDSFEREFDENTKTLGNTLKDLNALIQKNYKFEDAVK